jgi:uncharacterized protein YdcH (DUF465 family)
MEHHPLIKEFPDMADKIHDLKMNDAHFKRRMEEYEAKDKEVVHGETDGNFSDEHLETLKKERLALKDELYGMLKG